MLELRNIKKTYHVGEIETKALDDISIAFRKKEFVAILGTSGSGKTTCLNIIGGLDRYDSGELLIKGKPTSKFKDKDWDAYRNNSIGFVFQNYNLIAHLSIVENVELSMTLSGVSGAEKHSRALEVLRQVGLGDHLHKRPNQLSGGQMQRVAIARALVNNPEILLCDEPTGALDTTTSVQIMDLIKDLSKDRLVIMVTHNPQLAEDYADRTVRFQDGKILSDSHPHEEQPKDGDFELQKTSMSFPTALRLSFNNIRTKKGRTFLTAFASSIGIIGIAVILSLSSGFKVQIDKYQQNALKEFPITISHSSTVVDKDTIAQHSQEMRSKMIGTEEFADTDAAILYDPEENQLTHVNQFTDEFMEHLKKIDPEICSNIGYTRIANMNLVRDVDGERKAASFSGTSKRSMDMTSMMGTSSYPVPRDGDEENNFLTQNYDILAGTVPKDETEIVLVVDTKNRVDQTLLKNLGFDTEDIKEMKFEDLIGTEFKIIPNNAYYQKSPLGNYLPGTDYDAMFDDADAFSVRISAVVRQKESSSLGLLKAGIAYSDALAERVAHMNEDSEIVKAQKDTDYNVMTMEPLDADSKDNFIAYLGGVTVPYAISIYPNDFESKDQITAYLDEFNEGKDETNQILYTDLAEAVTKMTGGIMDGITIVLVAFAAISLVVSLIMICIITYTSVLERTKEIGILRALGARKKDITRVFDAETFLLGIFSGVLGVVVAGALTIPINQILLNLTDLENVAQLLPLHAVFLVVVSTILTVLGGHIPARMASKKDAVEALRTE